LRVGKRLEKVLSLLEKDIPLLADIGTDHGYLALCAITQKNAQLVYASDISKDSLLKAQELAVKYNLQDRIKCIVSDGFKNLKSIHINTAVIAGMGGNEIVKILQQLEDKKAVDYFILQPMQDVEVLREYLLSEGFVITHDEIVEDKGKFYSIIKCKYDGNVKVYNLEDIVIGMTDKKEKGQDFLKFVEQSIEKLKPREKYLSVKDREKLELLMNFMKI